MLKETKKAQSYFSQARTLAQSLYPVPVTEPFWMVRKYPCPKPEPMFVVACKKSSLPSTVKCAQLWSSARAAATVILGQWRSMASLLVPQIVWGMMSWDSQALLCCCCLIHFAHGDM